MAVETNSYEVATQPASLVWRIAYIRLNGAYGNTPYPIAKRILHVPVAEGLSMVLDCRLFCQLR